ncbi:mitochondrial aspartate-glutamate transporter agc1 [Lobulomyces angularis]|nr:mitochondrial aspartate-glutamate transporter agc1 [Lobulomyces angularis]
MNLLRLDTPKDITQISTDIFNLYASEEVENKKYLNRNDFINAIKPIDLELNLNFDQNLYSILFKLADKNKSGLIDLDQFVDFEKNIFLKPDNESKILFKLLDEKNKGHINVKDLKNSLQFYQHKEASKIDFTHGPLASYLRDEKKNLSFNEFTEFLTTFRRERFYQEFNSLDYYKTSVISLSEFKGLIKRLSGHKLSDQLENTFDSTFPLGKISFAAAQGIFKILENLDALRFSLEINANPIEKNKIITSDFFKYCLKNKVFTTLELDLIFKLVGETNLIDEIESDEEEFKKNNVKNFIDLSKFEKIFLPSYGKNLKNVEQRLAVKKMTETKYEPTGLMQALFSTYNFVLGSIAGALGASAVYPIDLVKTRMQNQRSSKFIGQILYKNSLDCFRKVFKNEGIRGFYSGLIPQLVGVAPEKAIKLTMNDLVRSKFKTKDGSIPVFAEILAGAAAGGSQVVFTNPLEIVKIRLQVQGEAAKATGAATQSAMQIVRGLGLFGLYKGVGACLLRDVPFSAIYFPTYAHLKSSLFNEGKDGKKLAGWELLVAGAGAGVPAAYLVTPADVIKTRLQVAARSGETTYNGLVDCFTKIMKEEGPRAFFKGGVARIFRSSPQFGVTLFCYEKLHGIIPFTLIDPKFVDHSLATTSTHKGVVEKTVSTSFEKELDSYKRNSLRTTLDILPRFGRS